MLQNFFAYSFVLKQHSKRFVCLEKKNTLIFCFSGGGGDAFLEDASSKNAIFWRAPLLSIYILQMTTLKRNMKIYFILRLLLFIIKCKRKSYKIHICFQNKMADARRSSLNFWISSITPPRSPSLQVTFESPPCLACRKWEGGFFQGLNIF